MLGLRSKVTLIVIAIAAVAVGIRLARTLNYAGIREPEIERPAINVSDSDVWADEPGAPRSVAAFTIVNARHFQTMKLPILAGRTFFDDRDTAESPRVAIVSEAFAARYFPSTNPVGRRFWRQALPAEPMAFEIVGVAADVKYQQRVETQRPLVYLPMSQHP